MGKIKKILETELVGGTQSTDVYPVTSTKAVYDTNNKVLDDYIQHLKKTSTFASIATPTTNPGTPDGNVFYIAGEGTYPNFSNLVIDKGQLGILKWNGTWSKEVLEIGAGGGGGVVDTAAITKIVNDTIKNVSWWGQKINNNKVDGNIVITKGSHSFTIELDDNGNLKFNGNVYATGGITALGVGTTTGGGSGVSLGTLLTKLNSDNPFPTANGQVLTYDGSNFIWKTPTTGSGVALNPTMSAMNDQLDKTTLNTPQFLYWDGSTYTWKNESEISGGSGGSIQVAQTPESSGGSESWVSATKLRFVGITGTKPTIRPNSNKGCVDVGIPTGSGSGSSSRIKYIKLFTNNSDYSFETVSLGTADTIGFMAGNNVSLEAVVKEFTNVIKISATGSGGSSGSTSTSVDWEDVTNKPSTFTPSSHTHSASDISGLSGVKVNNATNADKATQLANSRTIWGQRFDGTSNINGNLYMGSEGGGSIQLWMNNGNMLDRTNNTLHIGYGLKASSDGEINLDAYKTVVYTDNMTKHYDFKSNVFDVNSNQIHFGSETNGGKIYWDAANNAFKIEGNVYATGGITALGVSNNATTSNNVDFTFKSVTADSATFDKLYLRKEYGYGLFVGTKCALWGAIETDAIHFGGNFNQVYMTELVVLNSNSKQCYFATRIQSAKGLSLLDGYLDVTYNGTTYKFDFAKAKELGLLINAGVQTLSDEVDYANIIQ